MKTDRVLRSDLPGLPFDAYSLVEVEFLAADTDTPVTLPEAMRSSDPALIGYIICSVSAPAIIYDSREVPGGLPWTDSLIYLRSSLAPATVAVLLLLHRPS